MRITFPFNKYVFKPNLKIIKVKQNEHAYFDLI